MTLDHFIAGRVNIIISNDESYTAQQCCVVHSIDNTFKVASKAEEMMVIGGVLFFYYVAAH